MNENNSEIPYKRTRPSWDIYFMNIAELAKTRSSCIRRQVGAVLVNDKHQIISTGYNGVPRRFPHCNEGSPCMDTIPKSGTDLEKCRAVHAEQNALLQCPDVEKIETCYTTTSPCITCIKLLLNTACRRIVFSEEYPHAEARELWLSNPQNEWLQLPKYL